MGFLGGLGQLAANAVAPTLNVAAARAQGQRQEEDAQRQQTIQQLLLKRQIDNDQVKNDLERAQAGQANARANMYAHPPAGYTVKEGADGSFYLIQTKGEVQGDSGPQGGSELPNPQSTSVQSPSSNVTPSLTSSLTSMLRGGSPNLPTFDQSAGGAPANKPPAGQSPSGGSGRVVATGIKASPRVSLTAGDLAQANLMVNGKPTKGFADKQGHYYDANRQPFPAGANIAPFAPPVQPAIVQGSDTSGMHFFRVPKAGGDAQEIGGITPKPAGGGATGSQAPVEDMDQRLAEIRQHALDLAAGKWRITPAMQTREGLTYAVANASAGGHPDIKAQLGGLAMDAVGAGQGDNKGDFARYQALMNSTRALGDDAAKVFKGRQNEDAVKREIALAQLTPDDYKNPTVVNQKLQRLQNITNLARATMPKAVATPQSGGAKSDPLLKKYNLTPPGDE